MRSELLIHAWHLQNTLHSQCCNALQLGVLAALFVLCSLSLTFIGDALSSDGLALLKVKAAIKSDPLNLLSDWIPDDLDPCRWTGVGCEPVTSRVTSINFTGEALCTSGEGYSGAVDGSSNSYQLCPSLASQIEGFQCSPWRVPTSKVPPTQICLRNRTVVQSSSLYLVQDRVPCRLAGSLSPAIGSLSYLQVLALPFNDLSGELPKEVGNLSKLEVLDLRANAFSGSIPAQLGRLSKLQILRLEHNFLENEIPSELSRCMSLSVFNLAGNLLSGRIPPFLGELSGLRTLMLSFNQLDGLIPIELSAQCSSLEYLHLEGNFLFGTIPPGFGNCSNLRSLVISSNFLSGPIPNELGLLGKLEVLDVSRNSLAGIIPEAIGNCTNLSMFVITNLLDFETCNNRTLVDPVDGYSSKDVGEFNYFTGALPNSVTGLPNMRLLWAPGAGFLTNFPTYWGACLSLEVLNLGGNSFTGKIPVGLARCRKLVYLDLSLNSLEGSIPHQLASPCMIVFNMSGNFLSGTLSSPAGYSCPRSDLLQLTTHTGTSILQNSRGSSWSTVYSYFMSLYHGSVMHSLSVGLASESLLVIHDLSRNNITGPLPKLHVGRDLLSRSPTYRLYLSENQFNSSIPGQIFSVCERLQGFYLVLSHNLLGGGIPDKSMQGCKSLKHFEAASNMLVGSIPPDIQHVIGLVYLDLQGNNLSGEIPPTIGQIRELQYLSLAGNFLHGAIPGALGDLRRLVVLDLSYNQLGGEIPPSLANLRGLEQLLLNNNLLFGVIPMALANITSLLDVNLTYNNLSGPVPGFGSIELFCNSQAVFVGNPNLQPCTAPTPSPVPAPDQFYVPRYIPTSPSSIAVRKKSPVTLGLIIIIIGVAFMAAALMLLLFCYFLNKQQCWLQQGYGSSREKEVVVFANLSVCLTYENVVRATGNFSVDNLIGNGGFGATYKAELKPGLLVAVKRLFLGRVQGVQHFVAEVQTLGRIRHAHLVTLIGYHASDSEKFLIYNYFPGGNLETLLEKRDQGTLSWKVLHKIGLDVAQALDYLHNGCHPRVLHRDIKPSNILLDRSLNAYLSDFGLARFLGVSETHATTDVAGTFGYLSPEYAMTGRVSDKADVYSYGVVLLELLSGKKIYDPSYGEENITAWASDLYGKGQHEAVLDWRLWEQGSHAELIDTLDLAIACTQASQLERPTMKQVVTRLKCCRLIA